MRKVIIIVILALALLPIVSADWTASLNTNLNAYYAMEETSSPILNGVNSGHNNGTVSGATSNASGKIGRSYSFDSGSTGYIYCDEANGVFDFGSHDFTINYWDLHATPNARPLARNSSTYATWVLLDDDVYFTKDGSAWQLNLDTGTQQTGVWVMRTIRRSGDNFSAWEDGTCVFSNTLSGALANGTTSDLEIGRVQGSYHDGSIDELGFWKRALSDAEITQLYNGGTGITYEGLGGVITSLDSPANNTAYTTRTVNFTVNHSAIATTLGNASLVIWNNDTGVVVFTNYTNITGTANQTNWTYTFATDGVYLWNSVTNNTDGTEIDWDINRTLTIDLTGPSVDIVIPTGSLNLTDTENDTDLNFTRSDAISELDTCWYSLDSGTNNITIPNCNNITINISHGTQTVDVWVNDTLGNTGTDSNSFHGMPLFAKCNSTLLQAVLNFTFKDEKTGDNINATIDDATFVYWVDNPVYNITYTNSSTKNHSSYAFCIYPNHTNITTNATIRYSESAYPQRTHTIVGTAYNNSTTNTVLYLLKSADGIYVTFQVVTQAAQPIAEVSVTAEKYQAGSYTLIGSGETGDDGGVTFWLDPDYQHRFNFTKEGYADESLTITPTQSQYTVVMGDEVTTNATSTSRGISFVIEPLNMTLINDTTYTFNFTITSTYWDLDSWGFILKNGSGNELARDSSTTGTGGTVNSILNTMNNSTIVMEYFWNIDGNYSNATRTWYVYDTEGSEWSLRQFFDHLRAYTNQEMFGLNEFSRTLIIFIFIFVTVGLMSYYSGMYSPAIILIEVAVLITLFDVGLNMVTNPVDAVNHFPTIFTWFIAIAVAAGEWFR